MSSTDALPPPPGYDPALTVSMRQADEGGGVRAPAVAAGRTPSLPRRELLVLLHGFNNHLREAEYAYGAFRDGQDTRLPPTTWGGIEAGLADSFWPGDAHGPGVLDKLDFLVYPVAVGRAQESGAALAQYIAGRSEVLQVHFVAHSLGCRVALETLRALQNLRAPVRIGRVCLMAAAVTTQQVGPGGRLRDALLTARELRVLYSPDDTVLHYAFPPGQTAAGAGEGFFPEAVGRHGSVPGAPAALESLPVPGADHSDYWGVPQFVTHPTAAATAQSLLAAFIGRDGLGRDLAGRADPAPRALNERTLDTRA